MIGILVKGCYHDAEAAAIERGIRVHWTHDRETGSEMYGQVADSLHDQIAAWFQEPGQAPFPVGTLLHYSLGR